MYELFTTLKIVEPFNKEHFLESHRRDALRIGEYVEDNNSIRKAFMIDNIPRSV